MQLNSKIFDFVNLTASVTANSLSELLFFRNCRKLLHLPFSGCVFSFSFKSNIFDSNFYTMKFSMFSIFRSRSLLASFFSISHVASFVNYFFSSFFVSSLGSSAPCDSLSILPNLPLHVNRFFCFFHLFSTFTYYPVFIIVIRHE